MDRYIPDGTTMVFLQNEAPTGWTEIGPSLGGGIVCRKDADMYTLTTAQLPSHSSRSTAGHEAAGPQKADAPDVKALEKETTAFALVLMKRSIEAERRGNDVEGAISALHRQHTRDGRPSRYLPEA